MEKNNINNYVKNFESELNKIIGQPIGLDHIRPTTKNRYDYIQDPKPGVLMFMDYYGDSFFVDIHPDDFERISSGEVSAHDYIKSAIRRVGCVKKNNINTENFAIELSKIIGQPIGLDHIHPTTKGREYYIQAPKPGAPMLLHHYRGTFFIDIHIEDFERISIGEVSAYDYIKSANWQVGYYWCGGSMIGGGYYQPLDLIGDKDKVRRYLQILSCRGYRKHPGYMPSEEKCANCFVENCAFSNYKKGNWKEEMSEPDPRKNLFEALEVRFAQENPGYLLKKFRCKESIHEGEIWVVPAPNGLNGRFKEEKPFALTAYVSNSEIQSLMMREKNPEDWNDYAKTFEFSIYNQGDGKNYDVTKENLEKAMREYLKKKKF